MAAYADFHALRKKRDDLTEEIVTDIKQDYSQNTPQTVAFITFRSSKTPRMLLKEPKQNCFSKLGNLFYCFKKKREFDITDKDGKVHRAIIKEAPEPEDVLWDNLGQSPRRKRIVRAISIVVTIAILVASFFIIFALARYQKKRRD